MKIEVATTTGAKFPVSPNLTVHQAERCVYSKDSEITLTRKEYDILIYFLQNRNLVLTFTQIYEHVWKGPEDRNSMRLSATMFEAFAESCNWMKFPTAESVRFGELDIDLKRYKPTGFLLWAFLHSFALKNPRASVRSPSCQTSKCRWLPVELPVVPT